MTIASTLAALALVALPTAKAYAETASSPETGVPKLAPGIAVRVGMTLDCANMTSTAYRYAVDHSYCSGRSSSASSAATPDGNRHGSCGDSWIYVFGVGNGEISIEYGFLSSLGTVVYRSLTVIYSGTRGSGLFNNNGVMASSSFDAYRDVYVGAGSAGATLGGTVTLWWGAQCILLQPYDEGTAF
jgi:hypothetical protein